MTRDKRAQVVADLRTMAEALRLRIVESDNTIMVLSMGSVVYRSTDPRAVLMHLELRRVSA